MLFPHNMVCRRPSSSCRWLPHLKDAINRVERQPRKGGQRVLLVVLVVYAMQAPAAVRDLRALPDAAVPRRL